MFFLCFLKKLGMKNFKHTIFCQKVQDLLPGTAVYSRQHTLLSSYPRADSEPDVVQIIVFQLLDQILK